MRAISERRHLRKRNQVHSKEERTTLLPKPVPSRTTTHERRHSSVKVPLPVCVETHVDGRGPPPASPRTDPFLSRTPNTPPIANLAISGRKIVRQHPLPDAVAPQNRHQTFSSGRLTQSRNNPENVRPSEALPPSQTDQTTTTTARESLRSAASV